MSRVLLEYHGVALTAALFFAATLALLYRGLWLDERRRSARLLGGTAPKRLPKAQGVDDGREG